MTMTSYLTNTGRINKFKGEILAHAVPVECLGITGSNKKLPKNNGDTVVYRRWLPVAATITYNLLSKVARNLLANHAKAITSILAPSPNFNTAPVEAAFLVFCHTDCEHDIRQLPDFKHVSEYGSRKPVHDMELGSQG